jgi:hypothetical protein
MLAQAHDVRDAGFSLRYYKTSQVYTELALRSHEPLKLIPQLTLVTPFSRTISNGADFFIPNYHSIHPPENKPR